MLTCFPGSPFLYVSGSVGHKGHLWEILRAQGHRSHLWVLHIPEQLIHLSPRWHEWASRAATSPPSLGFPFRFSSSWVRCVCSASWERTWLLQDTCLIKAGGSKNGSSLPTLGFCCSLSSSHLSILVWFLLCSLAFYIGLPFWLLPCGLRAPASDMKIMALQIYKNKYRYEDI